MCGIFGYVGKKKKAAQIVLEGLKALEYRGYDSWGVAVISNQNSKAGPLLAVKKKAGKIGGATVEDLPGGQIAIGHTRWATHGGVSDVNAHPQIDCQSQIAVIHNGIFENYEDIKKKLVSQGHRFLSETDTETIVHLTEDLAEKTSLAEATRKVFNQMEGLNAVIAVNARDKTLVAARNGSPLIVGFGRGENFLASDVSALLPHTKMVYFLEDDEMAMITADSVKIIKAKTKEKKRVKPQKISWKVKSADKGKYPYFMLKEIYEQPRILAEIVATETPSAERLAKIIKDAKGVYLIGCGTASYACLAGTYFFAKIAKFHVNWAVGSEFGYQLDFLNQKSLVVAISQSGETMDILESVKKARKKGAKIGCLTNVLGCSLYRLADEKNLLGAGPEKAVASTKAFTAMLAHLLLTAFALDGRTRQGQKVLAKAVRAAKKVLSNQTAKKIQNLAQKLKNKKHLYVIGRGISFPTGLEAALKIKEISYLHAEGLAAGELKHGPLALVEKGTPCLAFLPNDETYGANLAGAMEMKARGGLIIGVSFKPHEVFDYFLAVEDAGEATIIPNVVVAQLLAYHLAIKKGLDPDKPRNLAKSVTVK